MASADWRGKDLCGVISLQGYDPEFIKKEMFPKLVDFFVDNLCEMYAMILHDKDLQREGLWDANGVCIREPVLKIPHIHFVAEFNGKKRGTKMTCWIGKIARSLGVDVRAVTLEKAENLDGCIQYLTHLHCPEKYHYPTSDIVTSMTPEALEVVMSREVQSFTFDILCEMVDTSSNLRELIKRVGFKRYIGYRNVIMDLWKDKFYSPEYQLRSDEDGTGCFQDASPF